MTLCTPLRTRPYDGREPLDPTLLKIAATGLVPLDFVARRLGIDGTELLARHGYLLIEERDRLKGELLGRFIDNPHADPITLLALTDADWALSGRERLRRGSRAWSASTLLQRLLAPRKAKGGRKAGPSPGTRMTSTGTVLRSMPTERDRTPVPVPAPAVKAAGECPWSLAEIDACALLMQVTEAEWADVIRLSGREPCETCGGDLRAFVHERVLENLLAAFRGHKSPRVRLLAGRLWLQHQGEDVRL
ncbi:hypothetical protein ACD578_10565 [Microvirga sp. RSM25]|uniref:hypothetical protein n=1 Tax=Microvirga sp. RSM25 TaxID=3273802 RepID=UPI00384F7095